MGNKTKTAAPVTIRSQAKIVKPTLEQRRKGTFELDDVLDRAPNGKLLVMGQAYKRLPWFETMFRRGMLSDIEVGCLRFYRRAHEASEWSEVKSCLLRDPVGGGGDGQSRMILEAKDRRAICEQAIGAVLDTMRAIAIRDLNYKAAAIQRFGSRERSEIRDDRVVSEIIPISRRHPKIIEDEFLQGLSRLVDAVSFYVRLER